MSHTQVLGIVATMELIVLLWVSLIVQIRIDDGKNPDYFRSLYDLAQT